MKPLFTLLLLCLLTVAPAVAQKPLRVMSYNVENLFDLRDNPDKEDDEFLPSGLRRWTSKRYYHKLQQLSKVITAAGEWESPALIGMCEVENDSVLHHLLTRTPLRQQMYRYCVTQSADRRGINVALLYRRDRFAYLGHQATPAFVPEAKERPTRDLLHVWGRVSEGDTLDVFVCHFPSRYGGEVESEGARRAATRTLLRLCDSIRAIRSQANLLVMGDLNEVASGATLQTLQASGTLVDLFANPKQFDVPGSHKYRGEWSQLDHILVSPNLLNGSGRLRCLPQSARIFSPSFLLIKDKTWLGMRPFRTYHGYKYEGGYADHLPLLVDLELGRGEFHADEIPVSRR